MKQDFNLKQTKLDDNSVVIKKHIKDIEGGRTLDVNGFANDVIKAGHVIIVKDGTYKPMPVSVSGTAYDTLPSGYTYAGVLYSSIEKEKPAASIMTWGVVNSECVPYPMTSIMEAFKAACPHISFEKDEVA